MRSASIAMLIVCCSFSTFCGNPALIGNLRLDLLASANDSMITSGEMPKTVMEKKNPLVTGLYSLVIPGAGEFTTENYTKSAIFLSVEALLVAATIIYNNKSNNQFNVFENYANANWSIDRYAEWINNHGSDYQSGSGPGNGNITIYPNPTLQQYATMIARVFHTNFRIMIQRLGLTESHGMSSLVSMFNSNMDGLRIPQMAYRSSMVYPLLSRNQTVEIISTLLRRLIG
jgi:hypothetical protein